MKYDELKQMLTHLKLHGLVNSISDTEKKYMYEEEDASRRTANGSKLDQSPFATQQTELQKRLSDVTTEEHDTTLQTLSGKAPCSFCFYQKHKTIKAKRKCSQCDQLALCLECSDKHVERSHHLMLRLGHSPSEHMPCLKHCDLPRKLKHRCITCNCDEFLCDLCLAIDHKRCNTYELCAVGKDALVQTRRMANDTKRMLPSMISKEVFDKIGADATGLMEDISKRSYQQSQNILVVFDQLMKAASQQRDDLLKRVTAATDYTGLDKATGRYSNNTLDSDILKYLRDKLKACPVLEDYTKPEEISMGVLREDDDEMTASGYANLRSIPPVPPRRASVTTPTSPDDPRSSRTFPSPTQEQCTAPDLAKSHHTQDGSDTGNPYASLTGATQDHASTSTGHPAPTQAEDGTNKSPEDDPILYEELPSTSACPTPRVEECRNESWTLLPKCKYVFSLAMLSQSRYALLTGNSKDCADTLTAFNADETSINTNKDEVHKARRLTVNRSGDMVLLLLTKPPSIRVLRDSPDDNKIINIHRLVIRQEVESPRSLDVDINGNYCIIYASQLKILQPSGITVTSIKIGDSRYVNCTGTVQENMKCMFTVSRTAVASYAWNGLRHLNSTRSGPHQVPNFEITGSCCNEVGNLFVVGRLMNSENQREVGLYQLTETDHGWGMQRLDDGSLKCKQEPRISYCNGHILIVLNLKERYAARMFKLNPQSPNQQTHL